MTVRVLVYIASCLVALGFGHVFVRQIMKRFRPSETQGVPGAGALIGFLERALVLTFVLLNQYTAIGLVLTAKSIARYKELENRRFAEYYIIGTLGSMLFAILIGIAAKWLLSSLP